MKEREALKLALEWYDSGAEDRAEFEAMIKSILAQPEQDTCKGCNGNGVVGNILDTDTCPFCKGSGIEAQPEQDLWEGATIDERWYITRKKEKPMHPEIRKMWEEYFDKCFQTFAEENKKFLAQPEQEPDLSMREPSAIRDRLIRAGWTPPAQPEQEPVACPSGPATSADRYFYEQGYKAALRHTTPPQRTWVGLTDEEFQDEYRVSVSVDDFRTRLNNKLKEKNT